MPNSDAVPENTPWIASPGACCCPLKFKAQPISLIQVQNIGLSGTNRLTYGRKFIDQTDKPSSFILGGTMKLGNGGMKTVAYSPAMAM